MNGHQNGWALAAMLGLLVLAPQALADGKVVEYVEARSATNPAPSMALDSFSHFVVEPIAMGAPYAGQDANEVAKQRLQANLDQQLQPLLAKWNAQPADAGKTLKILPEIRHIKFITGGKRFWGGAFAGGSAVLMTVKLVDAKGSVIAEPEFYQHANKMGAAWSFGATDKAMLIRLAELVAQYLESNYPQAVGGPTGKE